MVDVVLQGVWVLYHINNEGKECLPLLAFRIDVVNATFLNTQRKADYPRAMQELQNIEIASDICYNNTKHYQVRSETKQV